MPRYSLGALMVGTAGCCVLFAIARLLDFAIVANITLVGSAIVALAVWVNLAARAPEATKYFTVFFMIGLSSLSVGACWMAQSREQSRQIRSRHGLQRYGTKWMQYHDAHGPVSLPPTWPPLQESE
jgi:hypothetical protein